MSGLEGDGIASGGSSDTLRGSTDRPTTDRDLGRISFSGEPTNNVSPVRADRGHRLDTATFPERYALGARVGEGGMGEVFVCTDHCIGRDVAYKRLRRDRETRRDLRERFLREGRVQGQLDHPSVVPFTTSGWTTTAPRF